MPEEWPSDEEVGLIHILDKDWSPREDDEGRKLDYIEWHVFYDPLDETAYEQGMVELLGLDLDLAAYFREVVRGAVEEPAAGALVPDAGAEGSAGDVDVDEVPDM